MKAIKNIFLVLGILVTVSGCDYLDSEPEKKGTLEEAFASVNSARNFLYACYSFMPESSDHNGEPQFNGASDNFSVGYDMALLQSREYWVSNGSRSHI